MGGLAQINCMKQFVQFGMDKDMALGGALFELESIKAVPKDAQAGWWTMEWWWDQPNVPHVAEFVARFPQGTAARRPPRATGSAIASVHSSALAAERRSRSTRSRWRTRWRTWSCRPKWRCSRASRYRAGDHELMSNIFVGEVHPPTGRSGRRVHHRKLGARREGGGTGRRYRLQDELSGLTRDAVAVGARCAGAGARLRRAPLTEAVACCN